MRETAVLLLVPCASPPPQGLVNERWVSFPVDIPDRSASDIIGGFRHCARQYGCSIDRDCTPGFSRHCYGVRAYCFGDAIALRSSGAERYLVSCPHPSTAEHCNALLTKIIDQCG